MKAPQSEEIISEEIKNSYPQWPQVGKNCKGLIDLKGKINEGKINLWIWDVSLAEDMGIFESKKKPVAESTEETTEKEKGGLLDSFSLDSSREIYFKIRSNRNR